MTDTTMRTVHGDDAPLPGTAQLSESDRHRLLAAERRRVVLDVLAEESGPTTLFDLAGAVATRESTTDVPDPATVDRVAVSLHHTHLPKMAALGVVEYDPDTHRIE